MQKGHKIPNIENLGVAGVGSQPISVETSVMLRSMLQEQDAIDFTDNDILSLGNFPLSPRLRSLYCARNRISSIEPTLAKSIPHLKTLVLSQNQLSELADLDPLFGLKKLTHLALIGNPVTAKEVG